MASERPQDCVSRALLGTATGAGFGAILGAITANWSDVPKVIRNQSWPAFKQTGSAQDNFILPLSGRRAKL